MRAMVITAAKFILMAALSGALGLGASSCWSEIIPMSASDEVAAQNTLDEPGHRL